MNLRLPDAMRFFALSLFVMPSSPIDEKKRPGVSLFPPSGVLDGECTRVPRTRRRGERRGEFLCIVATVSIYGKPIEACKEPRNLLRTSEFKYSRLYTSNRPVARNRYRNTIADHSDGVINRVRIGRIRPPFSAEYPQRHAVRLSIDWRDHRSPIAGSAGVTRLARRKCAVANRGRCIYACCITGFHLCVTPRSRTHLSLARTQRAAYTGSQRASERASGGANERA